MSDTPLWTRIGNRVPRVATLAIGLLALFGLSVIRLVLVLIPRDQTVVVNGYLDGTAAGILWLGCAIWLPVCAAAVVVSIARRQWRALIGRVVLLVCAAFVGLWSLVSVGLLGTKIPFSVVRAPKRNVYYALCDAMVFGDVVYEIAETRSLWSPHWKLAFNRMLLDYSEDGSLTSDPRLVLSRDESILVVSRGGQLTDAIDLEGKENLVTMVDWDAPAREYAWTLRTEQVEAILKEHGGAAP